jgi:selenide,water dikinase
LKIRSDPNLITGFEDAEDAGVYRLTDEIAIIQTVDFFPPIVDDPYDFGQIAVANALSDVYAMGGKPLTALNLVSFPKKRLPIDVLKQILDGGLAKLEEAETTLVGGHSVEDEELKYGIAVTGLVHPDKLIKNKGGRAGDKIILTKPLGTGIINTALKADLASPETITIVTASMKLLNRKASEIMVANGATSGTDVTGFGLLGHLAEMISGEIGFTVSVAEVPLFPEVEHFAKNGIVPAGTHNNRESREDFIEMERDIPPHTLDILFDAQTSGGLLFTVPVGNADAILYHLQQEGTPNATIIGEVVAEPKGKILLR